MRRRKRKRKKKRKWRRSRLTVPPQQLTMGERNCSNRDCIGTINIIIMFDVMSIRRVERYDTYIVNHMYHRFNLHISSHTHLYSISILSIVYNLHKQA